MSRLLLTWGSKQPVGFVVIEGVEEDPGDPESAADELVDPMAG